MHPRDIIKQLGGPTQVATRLFLAKKGSVQRVANWQRRGIPARVLLEHADYFEAHGVNVRVNANPVNL